MEIPRRAFHFHLKGGRALIGFIGREFFSDSPYSHGEIIGLDRGRTQSLNGIPAFGDRFSSLIDRAVESLFSFLRTRRKQLGNRLKTEQQSVKSLQQSIMQIPRDAGPLADALFQTHVELVRHLPEAEPIERPQRYPKNCYAGEAEPIRLVPGWHNAEIQGGACLIPDAVVIARDYAEAVVAGSEIVVEGATTCCSILPV